MNQESHYLSKFDFELVKSEENRDWHGQAKAIYTKKFRLIRNDSTWNLEIKSEDKIMSQPKYIHVSGTIDDVNFILEKFELYTKRSFFWFLKKSKNIGSYYFIMPPLQQFINSVELESILMNLRDKEITISLSGNQLSFSFFFNNLFEERYFDDIINLLNILLKLSIKDRKE